MKQISEIKEVTDRRRFCLEEFQRPKTPGRADPTSQAHLERRRANARRDALRTFLCAAHNRDLTV